MLRSAFHIVRDALIATVALALGALAVNALRRDGIPLIADKPYELYVPCPEPLGTVELMPPNDPLVFDARSVLVDARPASDFGRWHAEGARNVVYDYLDPLPEEELERLTAEIAATGAARVVVYGDGDGRRGSTGYELGRELSGRGLRNVFVVDGGAAALQEANP